jgi:hypothetical protein
MYCRTIQVEGRRVNTNAHPPSQAMRPNAGGGGGRLQHVEEGGGMSCQGGEAVSASNVTTIDQSWLSRSIIHACEATARVHRARFRSRCDVAMEDLRRPGTSSPGGRATRQEGLEPRNREAQAINLKKSTARLSSEGQDDAWLIDGPEARAVRGAIGFGR